MTRASRREVEAWLAQPSSRDLVGHRFGLDLAGMPDAVDVEGRSPSVWRLSSATGAYALKVLPMRRGDEGGAGRALDSALAFHAACRAAGVPCAALRPVVGTGERCARVDTPVGPIALVCTGWIDPQGAAPVDDVAGRVGAVLATIHRVGSDRPQPTTAPGPAPGDGSRASAAAIVWAREADERAAPVVFSHRDLGPRNLVPGPDGQPWLVDWETSGPVRAHGELLQAALELAGFEHGPGDPAVARAVLAGYADAGGPFPIEVPQPWMLAEWSTTWVEWRRLHAARAGAPATDEEARRSSAEVRHGDELLRRIVDDGPAWLRAIGRIGPA